MSTNTDAMVRAGVDAYKAGKKAEARTMLERAIELDGYNETAWLWLSAVVESKEEQQTCLENVLIINPENDRARQGLKSLGIDPEQVLSQANDVVEEDEYAVPSSSASVEHAGGQASPDQYDDWVDGLNIGTNDESTDDVFGGADLFGDVDFSDDGGSFDIDDNIFNEDTNSGNEDTVDEVDYIDDSLYDDSDYIDDDLFDDGGDVFDDGDDMFADIGTLEDFSDAVGDVIDDYDDSQFLDEDPFAPPPAPVKSEKPAKPKKPVKEQRVVLTTEELYESIPKNIELTRPPGVSESVSSIHYMIIGVLALVNVGAIAFIGFQFVG